MFWGLVLVAIAAVAVAQAAVRLAPSDPGAWHVDPAVVERPGFPGHFLVRPEDGDSTGPVFAEDPAAVLAAFDAVALSTPRTQRLVGAVADGHVTYLSRSALWGFPDYISVRAVPAEGGTRLLIFSRLRFGSSDLGVNRARVEQWLAATQARLGG